MEDWSVHYLLGSLEEAEGEAMADPEEIRRLQVADSLRQEFAHTLPDRVERLLRAQHHPIVGGTPFAAASSECIKLFRDGHFYGCISLCQAAGEALIRHMCRCNSWRAADDFEENVRVLLKRGFIDEAFSQRCSSLWLRRHDYHHLNAGIATDLAELEALAFEKVSSLANMEGWAFAYSVHDGKLRLERPQYWPQREPGKVEVFLRLEP